MVMVIHAYKEKMVERKTMMIKKKAGMGRIICVSVSLILIWGGGGRMKENEIV